MVSYLFGLESMAVPHHRPRGHRACPTTRSSRRSARSSGTEFLWYAANRALQLKGGAGYMQRPALREDAARHPHLPDLRGRERRDARVHRAVRHQAARRGAEGAGRASLRRSDRARSGCWPTTCGGRVEREVRPDRVDAGPRRALVARRAGERPGAAAAHASARALLRKHGQGHHGAPVRSRSAWRTRSPTSTARSPCSRA